MSLKRYKVRILLPFEVNQLIRVKCLICISWFYTTLKHLNMVSVHLHRVLSPLKLLPKGNPSHSFESLLRCFLLTCFLVTWFQSLVLEISESKNSNSYSQLLQATFKSVNRISESCHLFIGFPILSWCHPLQGEIIRFRYKIQAYPLQTNN